MAILTPLFDDLGHPSYRAAMQQMALCHTAYVESPDKVMQGVYKLDPFAVELSRVDEYPNWSLDEDGLPPYVAFVADDQVWVVIVGTYTAPQWLQNVIGVLINAPFVPCDNRGQSHWIIMGRKLKDRLQAAGAYVAGRRLNFVGHSLGAAVAYHCAVWSAYLTPQCPVSAMLFAAPRLSLGPCQRTGGPLQCVEIQTKDDLVTVLPPNSQIIGPEWTHACPVNVVRPDGTLAADDYNTQLNATVGWNSDTWRPHFPREYFDYLRARYEDMGADETTQAVLRVYGYIPGLPAPLQTPPVVNPLPQPDLPAGWPPIPFGGINVALTRVQLFANWGSRGWSYVFYSLLERTDPTLQVTVKNLGQYLADLFAIPVTTGPYPQMVYYRLSDVNTPNKSKPFGFAPPLQSTNGLTTLNVGDRRNYPYATIPLASGGRRILKFKGAPRLWINSNINTRYGPVPPTMSVPFNTLMFALQASGFGAKIDAPGAAVQITAASVDANGRLNVTPATGTYTVGQRVKIKGMRGPGTTKLNGVTRVRQVLTGNTLVLNKKQCSPCDFSPENLGNLYTITPTFDAFVFPPSSQISTLFTGWSSGNLGRAFSPEPPPKRCCRK